MKKLAIALLSVVCSALGCQSRLHESRLHESAFHKKHEAIIKQHMDLLVKAGRITDAEHIEAFMLLGTYGWYDGICDEYVEKNGVGGGPCSFGAYTFSQAAYEQAKRVFIIHGQIEGGDDILVDVGSGAFDKAIVGYTVPGLTYCTLAGGKLRHCGANDDYGPAKVVEFIDKFHVRLDRKAKWDADMYGLTITPPDFVDMCDCRVQ